MDISHKPSFLKCSSKGADISDHMWSAGLLVNNPCLIRETHLAYYRAGADVVTSASYQASYEGFRVRESRFTGYEWERGTDSVSILHRSAISLTSSPLTHKHCSRDKCNLFCDELVDMG